MIRKRFFADGEESACISICGLGLFRLWINGHLVSADEGVPAWTDYEDRGERRLIYPISDTFAHRALYVNYDVSAFLVPGENVIGVLLGNGWFNQRKRNVEGDLWYGTPKLLFDLVIQTSAGERHVVSDTEMCWMGSHLVENNLYYGEMQDLRKLKPGFSLPGYDEAGWWPVELAGPGPKLDPQQCPPDRRHQEASSVMQMKFHAVFQWLQLMA